MRRGKHHVGRRGALIALLCASACERAEPAADEHAGSAGAGVTSAGGFAGTAQNDAAGAGARALHPSEGGSANGTARGGATNVGAAGSAGMLAGSANASGAGAGGRTDGSRSDAGAGQQPDAGSAGRGNAGGGGRPSTGGAGHSNAADGGQAGDLGGRGGAAGAGGGATVLGATPPMGWNSWNTFGCNDLNETLVKQVADAFVTSGMKDAGYQFVNLDDCWMNGRDASGKIQANATKFPSGMPALAAYIHGQGLKIGLYSTPGTKTCAAIYGGYTGGVGSLGHETSDAQTYAAWGIDYLKYDKCTADLAGFAVMRDALRATSRPIVYSINPGDGTGCVPGKCALDLPSIANLWRIGFDINASWSSVVSLIDQNAPLSAYAGPGHFNDPDMLEVGKLANDTEDRAHFSMWALMAAPLLAGNDVRRMTAATKTILTNTEVIAVDQDPLGVQGKLVATPGKDLQVWAKPLAGGDTVAVALLNRSPATASITATWSAVGIATPSANVRDLWTHTDLGSFDGSYATMVPSHGAVLLKVTGMQ